jgi:ArsR family transcriptional regulator
MDNKTRARYQARADVLKAMAHPTRLFIVEKLAQKPLCVADLTELIGDDVSTVSKHLSVLKRVGIVAGEKTGVQVHYSLRMPCVMNFFGCIETVLKESAKNQLWLVQ